MNIYLHVEISSRELHSKLLLAILAAAKGHDVIVSELEIILKGLLRGWLPPGIFYTKSLTPSKTKIERHDELIKKGTKITSIDEEANLNVDHYEEFSRQRYSEKTIKQSSAVFGWGKHDYETLKKNYIKQKNKIYKTGSPRVDLWRPIFSKYWIKPKMMPKKPFLLISSNMNVCDNKSFPERINFQREAEYFKRSPILFRQAFMWKSHDFLKAFVFIDAIKDLVNNNNKFEIVFRPHPSENVNCWKILLKGIPNLHITNEGPINTWINNAFAVMHHGCTTAIETVVSQKPLVTYTPSILKGHILNNHLPNKLGHIVRTKKALIKKIKSLYNKTKKNHKLNKNKLLPMLVKKKIYIDEKELSAQKIIKIWEKINNNENSNSINSLKIFLFIFFMKINKFIGNLLKILIPSKFDGLRSKKNRVKFPPIDIVEIRKHVEKLRNVLKIENELECNLISERTIRIKLK